MSNQPNLLRVQAAPPLKGIFRARRRVVSATRVARSILCESGRLRFREGDGVPLVELHPSGAPGL